jgi:gliding motility-associated-like protein
MLPAIFLAQSSPIQNDSLINVDKTIKRRSPIQIPASSRSVNMAGIQTSSDISPEEMIQDIFIGGGCFEAKNITYKGKDKARGSFSQGMSSIAMEDGIILTTGLAKNAHGPNNSPETSHNHTIFSPRGDDDLQKLIANASNRVKDVAIIEFDFIPTTDSISFEYLFASEEYCDYVGAEFNDVFGFFISGPGINGPFSNNAQNIALIPGTSDFVSINSVNFTRNSNFYQTNVHKGFQDPFSGCTAAESNATPVAPNDIQYDGFTTILKAYAQVIPCQTYHIKLAIGDVVDGEFDSAVFLKANSFKAGNGAEVSVPSFNIPSLNKNEVFESCDHASITIKRTNNDVSEAIHVPINISSKSTAILGVDYDTIPAEVIIPAGADSVVLPINIIKDNIEEARESIIFMMEAACRCENIETPLYIRDSKPLHLSLDTVNTCIGADVIISPTVLDGIAPYTYLWSDSSTKETLLIENVQENSSLWVKVIDKCGTEATASSILQSKQQEAIISGTANLCNNQKDGQLQVEFSGTGPYSFQYTIDGMDTISIENILQNPYIIKNNQVGQYELIGLQYGDCKGLTSGIGRISQGNLEVQAQVQHLSCADANNGRIELINANPNLPLSYLWSTGATSPNIDNLKAGTYSVKIADKDNCSKTLDFVVNAPQALTAEIMLSQKANCHTEGKANLTINVAGGIAPYNFQWNADIAPEQAPKNISAGKYEVIISDSNACEIKKEIIIEADTIKPHAIISVDGIINCQTATLNLDGTNSSRGDNYTYTWTANAGQPIQLSNGLTPIVSEAGHYNLTVKNLNNGCEASSTVLVETNKTPPNVSIATPQKLTCQQTNVQLDASKSSSGSPFEITWKQDGQLMNDIKQLTPNISKSGIYTLKITNTANHCSEQATVEVLQDTIPPMIELADAIGLGCNTEEVEIIAKKLPSDAQYVYEWTTKDGRILSGGNSAKIKINTKGTYHLVTFNPKNQCQTKDSTIVTESKGLELEVLPHPPLCHGQKGQLAIKTILGGVPPYAFSINNQPFKEQLLFDDLTAGSYVVKAKDVNNCQTESTIEIIEPQKFTISLPQQYQLVMGDSIQLKPQLNIPSEEIAEVLWTPATNLNCADCLQPFAKPYKSQKIKLQVMSQNGCEDSTFSQILVNTQPHFYVPNVFSPNNDGKNDQFTIFSKSGQVNTILSLQVFNRWGSMVFQRTNFDSNNTALGWDGSFNNEVLPDGVYVYWAAIKMVNGEDMQIQGEVTLLR